MASYDDLLPFIKKLPKIEQEMLFLVHVSKLNQKQIAAHFGMTQGAVSCRISRARKRIRAMLEFQDFDIERMVKDLTEKFGVFEAELVRIMATTTCQTDTARMLNETFNLSGNQAMTQVKVRHHFHKIYLHLTRLQENNQLREWIGLMDWINRNNYVFHEVRSPRNVHQ